MIPVTRAANRCNISAKIKSQLSKATVTAASSGMDGAITTQTVVTKRRLLGQVFSERERTEFLRVSTQLLFTIEFIILIEYTEVIVPCIYSTWPLSHSALTPKKSNPTL